MYLIAPPSFSSVFTSGTRSGIIDQSQRRVAMINQWKSGAITVALLWSILAAAQVWRAVVAHNPNDAGALASLGVVLSKEQKYPEAATAYRKALTLNPPLPGLRLN